MSLKPKTVEGKNILVGLTGGIACFKVAHLVSRLVQEGASVQVAMTSAACQFITPLTFESLTARPVFDCQWKHVDGSTPQHILLAEQADAMIVAPCTMDMLAKVTYGLTDDPVSLLCASIDRSQKSVILAPSMNATMLAQPATNRNLMQAAEDGFTVLDTEEGWQACRAVGSGRMPEPDVLLQAIYAAI